MSIAARGKSSRHAGNAYSFGPGSTLSGLARPGMTAAPRRLDPGPNPRRTGAGHLPRAAGPLVNSPEKQAVPACIEPLDGGHQDHAAVAEEENVVGDRCEIQMP